jgi:hypothetical protein
MKSRDLLIIVLSFVAGCILAFFHFKKTGIPNYNEEYFDKKVDSLNCLNSILFLKVKVYEAKVDSFTKEYEELEKEKSKIKYIYVKKANKIDSAFANDLVSEFKSVFAENNVK